MAALTVALIGTSHAPADPPEVSYRVIDLTHGQSIDASFAWGMNNFSEAVGEIRKGSESFAFVFLPNAAYGHAAGFHQLDEIFDEHPNQSSVAYAISDGGTIVGIVGDGSGGWHAYVWDLAGDSHGYLFPAPTFIDSELVLNSVARSINNSTPALIVGEYLFFDGSNYMWRGFRFDDSSTPVIETLTPPASNWQVVTVLDVSDAGRACGMSLAFEEIVNQCLCPDPDYDVCVATVLAGQAEISWWPETSTSRTALPWGTDDLFLLEQPARGVSNEQHIVGSLRKRSFEPTEPCQEVAVFWESDGSGGYEDAVQLTGIVLDDASTAYAISDELSGGDIRIVGASFGLLSALLWTGQGGNWDVVNLNEISCSDSDIVRLIEAHDINEHGWIVGVGSTHETLIFPRAFMLIPLEEHCPGDISPIPDGVVNVFDLLALLQQWGTCPPEACCLADLNNDGVVDVFDLLTLLGEWGACPGFTHITVPSIQDTLDQAGLTSDDWDDFLDRMENGTKSEQENYACWMINYMTQCTACPQCPGSDPFDR